MGWQLGGMHWTGSMFVPWLVMLVPRLFHQSLRHCLSLFLSRRRQYDDGEEPVEGDDQGEEVEEDSGVCIV
jgi:hypothetical protein